jgi:hypothetical protein
MTKFDRLIRTYEERLPSLLPHHAGGYALVHGDDLTVHALWEAAVELGKKVYGMVTDFLVIEIGPEYQAKPSQKQTYGEPQSKHADRETANC